jgi:hypothetical protein
VSEVEAACAGACHIDSEAGQVSFEGPAVSWSGDHDRHAAVLDGGEKVFAHPLGEFLLIAVEQGKMVVAPSVEDLSPDSHGVSRHSAIVIRLS